VTPVGAADIRDELGLAYGSVALVLLVAPLLLALLVEAPLLLLSDRWRRDRLAVGATVIASACLVWAACAESGLALGLALGAWAASGGLASALCEGALVDRFPDDRERWMTRVSLLGALGDAAAPLLLVGCVALGWSWRAALIVMAGVHLVHAMTLIPAMPERPCDDENDEDDDEQPVLDRLRAGLRDRRLLAWLCGASLCCLLDEVLVAFGALFLRDELDAGASTLALAFTIWALGCALGLAATDRLLRRVDPLRLLVLASLACTVVFAVWLWIRSVPASVVMLALIGACGAPLYPICSARAYAARPGEAGLVAAVDQLFAPIAMLAPLVLGLLADRLGIAAALALLLLQPIGVGLLGLGLLRRSPKAAKNL
jgi:MFS family permease